MAIGLRNRTNRQHFWIYEFSNHLLSSLTGLNFTKEPNVSRIPSISSTMSVKNVALSTTHEFSKTSVPSITLVEALGVLGDCHYGATVQHRSRLHIKPPPPNLRQVHLIGCELFEKLAGTEDSNGSKHEVKPGDLGENITTQGLDLHALGTGTLLHFFPSDEVDMTGSHAIVRVTGVRNPCPQIDKFQKGLRERCLARDAGRKIVNYKGGVMGVVETGGEVGPDSRIVVEEPKLGWAKLEPV
jgi:MOSC domain-containing protein YiiM